MATYTEVRSVGSGSPAPTHRRDLREPAFQAYLLLWGGFIVAPILFGIDKFFNWMTYWPKYLWVGWPHFFGHVSSLHFMYAVGVIEIVAGILVFLLPRFAPYVVAGWLAGIITNLVISSAAEGGFPTVHSPATQRLALKWRPMSLTAANSTLFTLPWR